MRSVLVTGASRGLGLGISRRLAASGYRTIALARKPTDALDAAIEEARRAGCGELHFVPFDLSEIDGIARMVKRLRKDFGPLYGLVNNAAIAHDGALALTSNSRIEQMVRMNTLSPIILTKYVVRSMMADGGGRIVNVASIIGFTGYSGLAAYGATKASLLGFTRSLAREVGRMKVNVNAVAPGFMRTEMTEGLEDEQLRQIARRSALHHLPDVDDVAHAIEYLLSERSKSITGTVLTVDAGNTA
ncbi:MAG: SDR family NAD(P)-dependent oxidoreductase [Burkholderiales bacterium]